MALVGRKHSSDDTFERVLEPYDRTVRIILVWNCHLTYKAANIHRYSRVVRDGRRMISAVEQLQNLQGTLV